MKGRLLDITVEEFINLLRPFFNRIVNHIDSSSSKIEERLKALEKRDKTILPDGEENLVIEDVSKITNRSIHTIRGYVQNKTIPFRRKGGLLEFKKSEILKWWEKKGK